MAPPGNEQQIAPNSQAALAAVPEGDPTVDQRWWGIKMLLILIQLAGLHAGTSLQPSTLVRWSVMILIFITNIVHMWSKKKMSMLISETEIKKAGLLNVIEMQSKTTKRYHLIPMRMAMIKTTE